MPFTGVSIGRLQEGMCENSDSWLSNKKGTVLGFQIRKQALLVIDLLRISMLMMLYMAQTFIGSAGTLESPTQSEVGFAMPSDHLDEQQIALLTQVDTSDSEDGPSEPTWAWSSCLPSAGTLNYVSALQLLGKDLAKAMPKKIKREAVTCLPDPCGDILVGRFGNKPTKERLLKPSCIYFNPYLLENGSKQQLAIIFKDC